MTKAPPPRIPVSLLAYVAVFGVFVFIYLSKVLGGAATEFDWITLGVAVFLLIVAAVRVLLALSKRDN